MDTSPMICAKCYAPVPILEDIPDGQMKCAKCGAEFGIVLTPQSRAEILKMREQVAEWRSAFGDRT